MVSAVWSGVFCLAFTIARNFFALILRVMVFGPVSLRILFPFNKTGYLQVDGRSVNRALASRWSFSCSAG